MLHVSFFPSVIFHQSNYLWSTAPVHQFSTGGTALFLLWNCSYVNIVRLFIVTCNTWWRTKILVLYNSYVNIARLLRVTTYLHWAVPGLKGCLKMDWNQVPVTGLPTWCDRLLLNNAALRPPINALESQSPSGPEFTTRNNFNWHFRSDLTSWNCVIPYS